MALGGGATDGPPHFVKTLNLYVLATRIYRRHAFLDSLTELSQMKSLQGSQLFVR